MEASSGASDSIRKKPYKPPSWSATPKQSCFSLEVVKGGQIAEKLQLIEKAFFILGRQPDADIVGEHSSLSRHHCVIQFGTDDGAFLCDLGSTHGTFLNKTKLEAFEYKSLKDGDVFKLGFSSRLYVFNASSDTDKASLTKETPTPKKKGVKRTKHVVDWGIREDAVPVMDTTDVDWRTYSESHELTQKQQKLADKIQKLERRKEKLELDSKRIHDKEAKFEELTPGQITALLSNERSMERVNEDLEELEEAIQTSILEKLHPSVAKEKAEAKKHMEQSDSDDEFYDRTKKAKLTGTKADNTPLSAEDLIRERSLLEKRQRFLESSLKASEAAKDDPEGEEDALDAFMVNLNADMKQTEKQDRYTEVKDIARRLKEIEKLLKFVDPDSFYARK